MKREPFTVRIATFRVVGSLPVWVSYEQGFFKAHGLDVKLVEFSGGSLSMHTLINGQVDFAGGLPQFVFALAGSQNIYLKLVHVTANNVPGNLQLIVRKDVQANSIEDLRGKSIGVHETSKDCLNCLSFLVRLSEIGFAPQQDFRIVKVPDVVMGDALSAGIIDAAAMIQPYASSAVKSGTGYPLMDERLGELGDPSTKLFGVPTGGSGLDTKVPAWLATCAYWTTEKYLNQNPEIVHNVARALADSSNWLMDPANREVAVETLVRWAAPALEAGEDSGADSKASADASFNTFFWKAYPDGYIDWKALQHQSEVMTQYGVLAKPIDATKLVSMPWFTPE